MRYFLDNKGMNHDSKASAIWANVKGLFNVQTVSYDEGEQIQKIEFENKPNAAMRIFCNYEMPRWTVQFVVDGVWRTVCATSEQKDIRRYANLLLNSLDREVKDSTYPAPVPTGDDEISFF